MPQFRPECTTAQAAKPAPRLRVLMLCAHEPTLDPRVCWEAESAVARFQVTVLGFNRKDRSKAAQEDICGYHIIRLPQRDFSAIRFLWRMRHAVSRQNLDLRVVALLLVSPLILLLEILIRTSRSMVRLAWKCARTFRGRRDCAGLSLLADGAQQQRFRVRAVGRVLHILAMLRIQFASAAILLWDHLSAMPEKPDVVHCNDLDTLLVGVAAKKHFGCRLIYDAHEFYPVSDPYGMWIDVKFFMMIEKLLIRHADAVVTVNPMLAELMRSTYGLESVHAVPNVEPWIECRPRTGPESPMSALAEGRLKFLFQGRFAAERGISELIQAWAMVDGDKAALFLRGPDNNWRQAEIAQAKRLGLLDKSVFFLNAVTEDQLVEAAEEADVGIIPYKPRIINDKFSCPNKLSQYLHAGLMIVSNDLPYVKSVIEKAQAGLSYDSTNLSTLASVVDAIVRDSQLLNCCRTNATKYARETFNWQTQGGLFHSLYALRLPMGNGRADAWIGRKRHDAAPVGTGDL
jgi:glycosyltransferase involved in cell wall biosynthesis